MRARARVLVSDVMGCGLQWWVRWGWRRPVRKVRSVRACTWCDGGWAKRRRCSLKQEGQHAQHHQAADSPVRITRLIRTVSTAQPILVGPGWPCRPIHNLALFPAVRANVVPPPGWVASEPICQARTGVG